MDFLIVERLVGRRMVLFLSLMATVFMLLWPVNGYPATDFKVLKTDPQGQMAIIRTSDGEMKIIRAGDKIMFQNKEFRVSSVREDALVLQGTEHAERIIVQITEKGQRVKRIRKDFRGSNIYGVK